MFDTGSLVRLADPTHPMHGRSGEIVSLDILTDYVTVEFYGIEPYSERKFRVPARCLESAVDAPKDSKPASARPGAERRRCKRRGPGRGGYGASCAEPPRSQARAAQGRAPDSAEATRAEAGGGQGLHMSKAAEELDRVAALLRIPAKEPPANDYERGIVDAYRQIAKALSERAAALRVSDSEVGAVH